MTTTNLFDDIFGSDKETTNNSSGSNTSETTESKKEKQIAPVLPPIEVGDPLSIEEIRESVPAHLRTAITQDLVDKVNDVVTDPLMAEKVKDNFITFAGVLREGKFKLEDYLNAVRYVSYKLMGYNNRECYARVFPQRYNALIARGIAEKDIAAYVSGYNKGKLVNLIYDRALIPVHVLNAENFQKAINVQVDLMLNAASEKVRTDAANSLLTHLKKPEKHVIPLESPVKLDGMAELTHMLQQLADTTVDAIAQGKMKTIEATSKPLPVLDKGEIIDV